MKLNKDLFLLPERLANLNTVKSTDKDPYRVIQKQLPKQFQSAIEREKIESIGENSTWTILSTIGISLLAGITLKGVLAKLWGMLATL